MEVTEETREIGNDRIPAAKLQSQLEPLTGISLEDRRAWQAQRLRLLWDHRRLLLGVTLTGVLVSALLAFLIPKSYTSTAQLMPPDAQSNSSLAIVASHVAKGAGGIGPLGNDLLGLKSTGALFIGILKSDASQTKLVEQFDLRSVYGVRLEQDARSALDDHTLISEDRKSGIISISVTDRSPQRAAALVNSYVDQLNSLIANLSTSAAHRERVFLEERLKLAKHDLDGASDELAQFSSQNTTLDLQTMGKVALDAAGNLAGELIAAQSELQGLRQIYTDDNSRVRSLKAQAAELRKQLDKMGGPKTRQENPGLTSAPRRAAAIGLPSDMPYPSLRSLPLLDVKYADYYRRAKTDETVYELLTEQYELSKIQEAKETPTVKVLDHPRVAEKKSSPPRLLIIFLGTLLAFATAVVFVHGSGIWRALDPQDPRKVLVQEVALQITAAVKAQTRRLSRDGNQRDHEERPLLGSCAATRSSDEGTPDRR